MKKIILFFLFLFFCQGLAFAVKSADENSLIYDGVNFEPYMKNLQKKIYSNWQPYKSDVSNNVVVFFKVGKVGNLMALYILKSSGVKEADDAALKAVEAAAPFKSLPNDFKGKSIDVAFTFDYKVFGKSRNTLNNNKKNIPKSNSYDDKLYYKQSPVRYDF